MRQILLIEDALEIQELVRRTLAPLYGVTVASSVSDARKRVDQQNFDLLLLDVTLPDGDGFDLCTALRAKTQVPILFLSGKSATGDKVIGLSLGASDYITKPFSPLELRARVQAHLRDAESAKEQREILRTEDLVVDIPLQRVTLQQDGRDAVLDLTRLEFKLLVHLARSPDQVFTREQLLVAARGENTAVTDRTVDVHLSHLRRKLAGSRSTIKAVPGVGYRFTRASLSPLNKKS